MSRQSKAKIIAICGICSAICTLSLLALTIPGARWFALALALVASIAVALPTMASGKVVYSILTYLASSAIAIFVGISSVAYIVPIVSFCMPMALIKIYAETPNVTVKLQDKTIDDPFGNGDDKQVVSLELVSKPRLKGFVKWILFYVVLEIGIALTLAVTYLVLPGTFQMVLQNKMFVPLLVAMQLLPILYNFLLRGAFALTAKTLKRHIQQ